MATDANELTVNYNDEDGRLLCKELSKEVLSKGAWATVMYKYADLNKQSGEYSDPKVVIHRYQKSGGEYKRRSKFNISSAKQARKVIETLNAWFPEGAVGGESGEDDE